MFHLTNLMVPQIQHLLCKKSLKLEAHVAVILPDGTKTGTSNSRHIWRTKSWFL